ncbi:uncharacterized protein B0I36DRAFT_325733, partial [Microdochium trichocladiopsis]
MSFFAFPAATIGISHAAAMGVSNRPAPGIMVLWRGLKYLPPRLWRYPAAHQASLSCTGRQCPKYPHRPGMFTAAH